MQLLGPLLAEQWFSIPCHRHQLYKEFGSPSASGAWGENENATDHGKGERVGTANMAWIYGRLCIVRDQVESGLSNGSKNLVTFSHFTTQLLYCSGRPMKRVWNSHIGHGSRNIGMKYNVWSLTFVLVWSYDCDIIYICRHKSLLRDIALDILYANK